MDEWFEWIDEWMEEVLYGCINRFNNGWIEMDGLIDKINDKMDDKVLDDRQMNEQWTNT